MKQRIRLTESDLHRIVKESVKRVLNEGQLKGTLIKRFDNGTDYCVCIYEFTREDGSKAYAVTTFDTVSNKQVKVNGRFLKYENAIKCAKETNAGYIE